MPAPESGESREDFLHRCIPMLMDEGKPQDQAVAICINVFDEGKAAEKQAGARRFAEAVKYGHRSNPCAGLRGQELEDCRRQKALPTTPVSPDLPVPIQPPAL